LLQDLDFKEKDLKNHHFGIYALWIFFILFAVVLTVKLAHIYITRDIFMWIFLLIPLSFIFAVLSFFQDNYSKKAAIWAILLNIFLLLLPTIVRQYERVILPKAMDLLSKHTDINLPVYSNFIALHKAARAGNIKEVNSLLDAGSNIEVRSKDGKTALILAARKGKIEMVELLLKRGANVGNPSKYGEIPINESLYSKHTEVAKLLINHGALKVKYQQHNVKKPLSAAVQAKNYEIAEIILKQLSQHEINSASDVSPTLSYVNKSNMPQYQETAISTAVRNDDLKMIELLVKYKVNLVFHMKYGKSLMHEVKSVEVAKYLKDHGADLSPETNFGDTPLFTVKDAKVAQFLIDNGADIEHKNERKETPILRDTSEEVQLVLINNGANIFAKDKYNNTVLHNIKSPKIISILIKKGADVNAKNMSNRRPLHQSMQNYEKAKLLLEAGANPNIFTKVNSSHSDADDDTPLHLAVIFKSVEIVKLLLEYDADINAKNVKGQNAFDLTKTYSRSTDKSEAIKKLLKEKM